MLLADEASPGPLGPRWAQKGIGDLRASLNTKLGLTGPPPRQQPQPHNTCAVPGPRHVYGCLMTSLGMRTYKVPGIVPST